MDDEEAAVLEVFTRSAVATKVTMPRLTSSRLKPVKTASGRSSTGTARPEAVGIEQEEASARAANAAVTKAAAEVRMVS